MGEKKKGWTIVISKQGLYFFREDKVLVFLMFSFLVLNSCVCVLINLPVSYIKYILTFIRFVKLTGTNCEKRH